MAVSIFEIAIWSPWEEFRLHQPQTLPKLLSDLGPETEVVESIDDGVNGLPSVDGFGLCVGARWNEPGLRWLLVEELLELLAGHLPLVWSDVGGIEYIGLTRLELLGVFDDAIALVGTVWF